MGLFTDPLVLNDGAANRTFSFRSSINDGNSVGAERVELAATIAANSTIVVKHTKTKGGRFRHLVQRCEQTVLPAAGEPITEPPEIVSLTMSHGAQTTVANMQKQVTLLIDAMSEANFVQNLMNRLA